MSIVKTITNDYEFAEWVKQSDSYSNNFTFEGANAVQAYYEQLSDELGENIEFDPIAWCCEFSEYDGFDDFVKETGFEEGYGELQNTTTVLETDGDVIIVQDF